MPQDHSSPEVSQDASGGITQVGVVGAGGEAEALAVALGRSGLEIVLAAPDTLEGLVGCGLVVEALLEDAQVKAELLARLGAALPPETLLATTTQALSVTELALATSHPERVLGLRLTALGSKAAGAFELTTTVLTDPTALEAVQTLLAGFEQTVLTVADRPGGVVPALLLPYLNDAARMAEARYASHEDIDAAMRLGCGHPTGPLALLDLVGIDTAVAALDALHARTGDHLHVPAPLLRQHVSAGRTGVRTGQGFFSYAEGEPAPTAQVPQASQAAPREVRTIGVIGTGTMAAGIVEVCARSGYEVVVRARTDDKVSAVIETVTGSLDKAVSRGRLEQVARDATLTRITGTTELTELGDCDLVIEAVVEDLAVKQQLFAELDAVCKPGAVLATTTSSLPVIECARVTKRPADFVGMHWFNPATLMQLVEVVPTIDTADDVVATVLAVCAATNKHPVVCGDRPGFIVNALLFPYLNDAVKLLEGGVADKDAIDAGMTGALGHPMGPFALMDVVGLDVTLAIQRTLHAASREPGHAPAPSLAHLVTAGAFGRKAGRGMRAHRKR